MKNLFLLLIFWCLWYLAFTTRTILSPLLPIIKSELGLTHAMAGGLYLFGGVGSTAASLLSGYLASKIGVKKLIIICFGACAAASIGISFATSYATLAGWLFLLGMTSGFYLPCSIPLITTIFQSKNWGKAISFHETAAGFNILTVPLIIAFALGFLEWRSVFPFFVAIIIIPVLVFWYMSPDPKSEKIKKAKLSNILKRVDFWIVLILWVNCSMTSLGVYNIVPLFLVDEKAMDIVLTNKVFGMSRIGGFVGQIGIGFFLDRFSTKKILFFLVLASGISTLGMALADAHWLLVTLLFLQATFSVVFFPVGIMAIAKLTEVNERTSYTGSIMAVSMIVGVGGTPMILGAIADTYSYQTGLIFLGILTLCLCPLVQILKKM
jgi:NNP family nitrate/nitrite transporter-like MFS transporter